VRVNSAAVTAAAIRTTVAEVMVRVFFISVPPWSGRRRR
jgi:hypothetical protein